MKVAAAYIRVSTDDQIEFSPDSQLEKIKLYAERNQMLLPKEFIFMDEGISGRNTKKRAAFNTMIGLAKPLFEIKFFAPNFLIYNFYFTIVIFA